MVADAYLEALAPEQSAKAIIGTQLPSETAGFHDNDRIPYEGICHEDLSSEQRAGLVRIVEHCIDYMRPGHAGSA